MGLVNFNDLFRGPQGASFGVGGFINGNAVGRRDEDNKPQGLLNRLGLNQGLGGLNLPKSGNSLLSALQENQPSTEKERDKDKTKGDRVDLNEFAADAAQQAVENARKSPRIGETSQVIVSEDGRFEASIDLRYKSDGSFDLDLAVKFAQASSTQVGIAQQLALPQEGELTEETAPARLSYEGLGASSARYTSYEQQLESRGFQANIFYEESKAISLTAERLHNEETGENLLSVSRQVAHEFTLNLSISADSLDSFNQASESLLEFDNTGTLKGFLDATRGVLNSDSSNLGSFLDATHSLLGAAKDHVSSKLSNFFGEIQQQFGQQLEDVGYEPEFLQNLGQDVQNDLNKFFQATQDFFGALGGTSAIGDQTGNGQQEIELLESTLEQIREQQTEAKEEQEARELETQRKEQKTEERRVEKEEQEKRKEQDYRTVDTNPPGALEALV